MDEKKRKNAHSAVLALDGKELELRQCYNLPHEGETISKGNMDLPELLRRLGEQIVEVDDLRSEAKNNMELEKEKIISELLKQIDPTTKKPYSKTVAETEATLTETYQTLREEWRKLDKAYGYLKVREKAGWGFFDASRQRASRLNREVATNV